MNHSPAYIIAQFLIEEGIFIDPSESGNWPLYVGLLPDGSDVDHDVAACLDTESIKDGRIFEDGENIFHEGFQIIIRAEEYNTGYQKAKEVTSILEVIFRDEIVISGTTYRIDNVTQTTGVVVLGQEEGSKRRELFSVNFLVTLKEI